MIEVEKLRKTYAGGVEAVKEIDFAVAAGEVFGLLGPNGAGKSTTIGMLTTTVRPTSGTARLAGFDVGKRPPYKLAVRVKADLMRGWLLYFIPWEVSTRWRQVRVEAPQSEAARETR